MKKMLITVLIVAFFSNVLLPTHFYKISAAEADSVLPPMDSNTFYQGANKTIKDTNIVFDGETRELVTTVSQGGAGATIFFDVLNVIPLVCNTLMSIAAYPLDNVEAINDTGETSTDKIARWFSIYDVVFGKISLFDINYSRKNSSTPSITMQDSGSDDTSFEAMQPGDETKTVEDTGRDVTNVIKTNVAQWFLAMRNLVVAFLLLTLIYIGIKMAMSSLSAQKGKYKKMLLHWVTSLILVFLLQYIIFFAINFSETLVKIFDRAGNSLFTTNSQRNIEQLLLEGDKDPSEKDLYQDQKIIIQRTGLINALNHTNGWNIVYISVVFWVLVYYQVKFFFLYLKRFLVTGFLIVISPLITVTYAVDKAGDGRAQAFSAWLKEFLVNVFIQPLHAILYLVFMTTAYKIAFIAPIIAVFFLAALSQGEKVVRKLFNIHGLTSIKSMSETMGLKLFKRK